MHKPRLQKGKKGDLIYREDKNKEKGRNK